MAKYKSKIEIMDKINYTYGIVEGSYYDDWSWDIYDDYEYYEDYCDWYGVNYEYIDTSDYHTYDYNSEYVYLYKKGKKYKTTSVGSPISMGRLIDMTTIYSREIMREKKIDIILGISKDNQPNTIGDYYNGEDIQRLLDSK